MRNHFLPLFIIAGLLIFIGCAPSTSVTAVWRNPELNAKTYNNICIAAITHETTRKQIVEQAMYSELKENGVKSTKINELLPYKFAGKPEEKEMILEKVKSNGNDAILTFALIKQKEETRYVPGNTAYAPTMRYGYYGTFGGYYGNYGSVMYDPGYYTQDEIYFIETNLYDVATEKLVWSVQSKTYNPSGIQQFSEEFSKIITKQLIKAKLIEPVVK